MAMKGGKSYTVADIEVLPEGTRAELIDEEMLMMASPTLTHQEYWIVDPQRETVTVYDPEHSKEAEEHAFSEQVKAGIYEDLYLKLAE